MCFPPATPRLSSALKKKILIVEDDRDISSLVELHLREAGFEVEIIEDGKAGLLRASHPGIDLIILDIMLPSMDGLEVCRALRSSSVLTPILILTSRNAEADKVLSLEFGADDYLTKPFGLSELRARVRALIRRHTDWSVEGNKESAGSLISLGPLQIDPSRREVRKNDLLIELTTKEFDLLIFLASNKGQVFARNVLLDRIWDYHSEVYEHTVTSHINRLRAKLEKDPQNPELILTVRGIGYKASHGNRN